MDVEFWLDLSGLDCRLERVRVGMIGAWWRAEVKIREVTITGDDDTSAGALANLVSSDLLWRELGEREGGAW